MQHTQARKTRISLLLAGIPLIGGLLFTGIAQALSTGDVQPWQTTTDLPTTTVTAASATYNGYEYILGGQGNNNAVYYAKLNSDGSVGAWQTSANSIPGLQQWRATAVAYNGYLYDIAGFNGGALNNVYYAPLNADGSVGTWISSGNTLPDYLESLTSVEHDGYVYVMGGNENGSVNVNTVYYAKLNGDGSIGSWTSSSSTLPVATRRLTSAVYGDYVYVLGGYTSTYSDAVYYAKLNNDGTVGAWSTSTNVLPQGMEQLTAEAYNGFVYAIGGDNGSGASAAVYYAPINTDGSIGAWQTASNPLPQGLYTSVSAAYNGYLYEFGGNAQSGGIATVYYAELTPDPASPTNPTTNSTVSAVAGAPDTGYGLPHGLNVAIATLTVSAISTIGAGLILARSSKR
ncbi:MAG TPA: hypothetical protein VHB72_01200 [Candidatus Saccharimonadales bacterium]|nr:hypothetical protein [Candidatus Saccharimonadales bacterium]